MNYRNSFAVFKKLHESVDLSFIQATERVRTGRTNSKLTMLRKYALTPDSLGIMPCTLLVKQETFLNVLLQPWYIY